MLTAEQNEMLTRVGPGTPMGELLRRYWYPVCTSKDLKENPVRSVRILGETLTLYRDRRGRLGLIGQRCAHRGVDMKCGIPEEEGLRCPYHGWLYDSTGQCIAQPSEANENIFKSRIKIPSYPVEELGGHALGRHQGGLRQVRRLLDASELRGGLRCLKRSPSNPSATCPSPSSRASFG